MKISPGDSLKKWHHFQDSDVSESFDDYCKFIHAMSGKLPLDIIKKRAEEAAYLNASENTNKILKYFEANPVITAKGLIAYVVCLKDADRIDDIRTTIITHWLSIKFSESELKELIDLAEDFLKAEDYVEKIDSLLEKDLDEDLDLYLPYVGKEIAREISTRKSIRNDDITEEQIAEIAENDDKSPGLIYDLVRWYRKKYKTKEAIDLLVNSKTESELKKPLPWWNERNILSRRMMEDGNWKMAYKLISGHKLTKGEPYSNAEWLLGWIELNQLKRFEDAAKRFMNLYQVVAMPVSKSRMAFWAGEAFSTLGDSRNAKAYYKNATKLPGTFYGQMSIVRLRALGEKVSNIDLHWHEQVSSEAKKAFNNRFAIKALRAYGENLPADLLAAIFYYAATQLTVNDEEILITQLAHQMGGEFLGVSVAKKAQYIDTVITKYGYPFLDKKTRKDVFAHLPKIIECFACSIIRQESNFSEAAVSSAKAKGLMQLMDATALEMRKLAPKFGLKHTKGDVHNKRVNVTLGVTHFLELLNKFDGYVVLALASYNAGDFNVRKWIEQFGDPRETGDWINWMEKIPFGETRNYVQRVIENAAVYYLLLKAKTKTSIEIINWITKPIEYIKLREFSPKHR